MIDLLKQKVGAQTSAFIANTGRVSALQ